MTLPTIVHIRPLGNLGNRMMQLMTAHSLTRNAPSSLISNIRIPEFNINYPDLSIGDENAFEFDYNHDVNNSGEIDILGLSEGIARGAVRQITLGGYCQNLENFGLVSQLNNLFPSDETIRGGNSSELIINIRLGDTANGLHPDYVLLPIEYYKEVVAVTGLQPVFMGQLDTGPYLNELKRNFPHASFVESKGAIIDFNMIRNSINILPAVSTFSWMASWLSRAKTIHFPIAGAFHPIQSRYAWLLPLHDDRYRFWIFPPYKSMEQAYATVFLPKLAGLWRFQHNSSLHYLRSGPRRRKKLHDYVEIFDESFYLQSNLDVAEVVRKGSVQSGLAHFLTNGFREGRPPLKFCPNSYIIKYPAAAIELSEGEYEDALHHYAEIGRFRGYR